MAKTFGISLPRARTLLPPSAQNPYLRHPVYKTRAWLRSSDFTLILFATLLGVAAGFGTLAIGEIGHFVQHLLYGVGYNRLSALASIRHPAKLLWLPVGGALLGLIYWLARRRTAPIDVVEANALHGGRIPASDSAWVVLQTIVSNGFGASVGLEAAYAQAGGGLASQVAQWLRLRRNDVRNLVGAGAGAAIAAAFVAPLTGAFYAFEVVIGAYTPAAIAPVAAASLAAALVARGLGETPYLTIVDIEASVRWVDYIAFVGLGLVCSVAAIAMMRIQTEAEKLVARPKLPQFTRPMIGGLLLVPLVLVSPQALSSGHGALRLDLVLQPALSFLLLVFAVKALASIVSISFGFRGGLFFASLFLGSVLGPVYAHGLALLLGYPVMSDIEAAVVGMAAFATAIVGAPMTLSLLVLEATENFSITGGVLAASICASAFTRANFGFSFSTWRLHIRGAAIRSPRDIGWSRALTARRMMRRDPTMVAESATVQQFRAKVPLGATSRVLLVGPDREYRGVVETARAYAPGLDEDSPVAALSVLAQDAIPPTMGISEVLNEFERLGSENLAVVDDANRILGVITESYVQRRYIEETEKAQSLLFGEGRQASS
jgi:CIC family chloride channel protein